MTNSIAPILTYDEAYKAHQFPAFQTFVDLKEHVNKLICPEGLSKNIKNLYPDKIKSLEEKLSKKPSSSNPKTVSDFINSAWKMYILARYKLADENGYNLIGRLHKPNFPISQVQTDKTSQNMKVGEDLFWKMNWHGHMVSFMEYTLQADYWDIFVNDAWILGGIHGKKKIKLLSHLGWNNFYNLKRDDVTVTAREYLGLRKSGYSFNRTIDQILIHGTRTESSNSFTCKDYLKEVADNNNRKSMYVYYQGLDRNLTIHVGSHYVSNSNGASQFSDDAKGDEKKLLLCTGTGTENNSSSSFINLLVKVLNSNNRIIDLTGVNLSGMTFSAPSEINASNLDFQYANFYNANLNNINFSNSDLRWANMGFENSDYLKNLKSGIFNSPLTTNITVAKLNFKNANLSGQGCFIDTFLKGKEGFLKGVETNIYVRDTMEDVGLSGTQGGLSNSPDIIVSQVMLTWATKATLESWKPSFENSAISDQKNYLYVRINNIGIKNGSELAKVYLYYRNFSTTNPSADFYKWSLVPKVTEGISIKNNLAGAKTIVGPFEWENPDQNANYCFMAYVSLDGKPLDQTKIQIDNFDLFVANHNRVSWRNISYINDGKDSSFAMIGLSVSDKASYNIGYHLYNKKDDIKNLIKEQQLNKGEFILSSPIDIAKDQKELITVKYNSNSISFNSEKGAITFNQNQNIPTENSAGIIISQCFGDSILGTVNFKFKDN